MYFPVSFFNYYFLNRYSTACSSRVSCYHRKGDREVKAFVSETPTGRSKFPWEEGMEGGAGKRKVKVSRGKATEME